MKALRNLPIFARDWPKYYGKIRRSTDQVHTSMKCWPHALDEICIGTHSVSRPSSSRRQTDRKDFTNVFIPDLKNRYFYCPKAWADWNPVDGVRGIRVTRVRSVTSTVTGSAHRLSCASRSVPQNTRKTQTETALRCYGCDGRGHFARDWPNRLKRRLNSLIHQAEETRPKVQGIRTSLAMSPR